MRRRRDRGLAERAARIRRNADACGVPGLTVVEGAAPAALAGLPPPDAIFIGGGGSETGVMDAAIEALPPGGRLVANAVTLEMEALLLAQACRARRRTDPDRHCARRAGRLDAGLAAGHAGHAMGLAKTMIVAGIGCRKGVRDAEVLAAIEAALRDAPARCRRRWRRWRWPQPKRDEAGDPWRRRGRWSLPVHRGRAGRRWNASRSADPDAVPTRR